MLNQEQKECTNLLASPEGRKRQLPGGNATLQVRRASRISKKNYDRANEPRPAGQNLRKGRLRDPKPETAIPCLDGRQLGEREGERTEREPYPPQAEGWGTKAPERKVSPIRSNLQPTKGKMDSVKAQGGSKNAKRSQEDHPAIQDEGTEKGKQLRKTRREQSTNGKAQARRRVASTAMEKPLGPHNRIPMVEENLPEQRNRPGRESKGGGGRDSRTTPKGDTSTSRRKRDTVPSCKEMEATTVESSHIMGT